MRHPGIVVDGDPDLYTKLAKCCLPVPGDHIFGFVTRSEGISVHRTDCTNVASLRQMPERIVPVSWAPTATRRSWWRCRSRASTGREC